MAKSNKIPGKPSGQPTQSNLSASGHQSNQIIGAQDLYPQITGAPTALTQPGANDSTMSALIQQLMNPAQTDYQSLAHSMYSSYYDQLQLAAQQAYENNILALQQQIGSLGRTYDQRRQEAANQYAQAISQADRRAGARGMGRSTYNMQVLANLAQAGADAQNQLWQYQAEDEGKINQQIALAGQQLSQQIQHYQTGQASDELSWIQQQQLHQDEQNNANIQFLLQFLNGQNQFNANMAYNYANMAQNQNQFNATMNYNYANMAQNQSQWQQQFDTSNQQWQMQWDAAHPAATPSSGSSYTPPPSNTGDTGTGGQSLYDIMIAGLSGSGAWQGPPQAESYGPPAPGSVNDPKGLTGRSRSRRLG